MKMGDPNYNMNNATQAGVNSTGIHAINLSAYCVPVIHRFKKKKSPSTPAKIPIYCRLQYTTNTIMSGCDKHLGTVGMRVMQKKFMKKKKTRT